YAADEMLGSFLESRSIDHQVPRWCIACYGKDVLAVGRKEAAVAGDHAAALTVHLHIGRAFQQIADLLNTGMSMRKRALPFFDRAHQDLKVTRAHRLGRNQPAVHGAAMVGG